MTAQILGHTQFREPAAGWEWPPTPSPSFEPSGDGLKVSASPQENLKINGPGVHTRNGDSIELRSRRLGPGPGRLSFGFDADGHEYARAEIDFQDTALSFTTSDWTNSQPVASAPLTVSVGESHVILIEKQEGNGNLVKNADVRVYFDGEQVLTMHDLNLLPETAVNISVGGTQMVIEEFTHRGNPSGIPEYLHLGGWQALNVESIEANLDSLCRGLVQAAEQGVQLLVTPETSLTGLFPRSPVTMDPVAVDTAELRLRRFIRDLEDAPYLVAGLPVWKSVTGHAVESTRYNVSRVYDPDGEIVSSHAKVHSAEYDFWHGYHLNEFEVYGFVSLRHRPQGFAHAAQIANGIVTGDYIRRIEDGPYGGTPLMVGDEFNGEAITAVSHLNGDTWGAVRLSDYSLAQTAYALSDSRLWLPGNHSQLELKVAQLAEIGSLAYMILTSQDNLLKDRSLGWRTPQQPRIPLCGTITRETKPA